MSRSYALARPRKNASNAPARPQIGVTVTVTHSRPRLLELPYVVETFGKILPVVCRNNNNISSHHVPGLKGHFFPCERTFPGRSDSFIRGNATKMHLNLIKSCRETAAKLLKGAHRFSQGARGYLPLPLPKQLHL